MQEYNLYIVPKHQIQGAMYENSLEFEPQKLSQSLDSPSPNDFFPWETIPHV